jgi:signal transduction histidine kinase
MIAVAIAALLVGFLMGRLRGARAEREAAARRLAALAAALESESDPLPVAGASSELSTLVGALDARWVRRGQEREEAVQGALQRLAAFLKVAVGAPLNRALQSGGQSYRAGVEDALGAIDDLEFFLEVPPAGAEETDMRIACRRVIREFVESWDAKVREMLPNEPVNIRLNADAFMDALFLILHNAAHFSGGQRITVELSEVGPDVLVAVRDSGPGFSADALLRALDPFYSTSEGGLGLGMPQARRLVETQGGSLRFKNLDEGGAEVTLTFPRA